MDAKTTEWRPGPTVCRCCLTEGCYKDISTEYFWMGKREVYAEMLSETFSVSIAYSQSGGPNSNSRLICEPCISRLRDAADFRRQVLECEKTFMLHLDPGTSVADIEVNVESLGGVKLERVKLEKRLSDDDFDDRCDFPDDDDDDLDDEPLTKLASKIPKKETVDILDLLDNTKAAEKRKSTTKTKMPSAKKTKIVKMEPLKAGVSKVGSKGTSKITSKVTSKAPQKTAEKKKKEPHIMAKRNAEVVLQYSTVYPFRAPGKNMLCVYCCEEYSEPDLFRKHVDEAHKEFTVSTAFAHLGRRRELLKVDITNLKCRVCSKRYDTIEEVAEHISNAHVNYVTRRLNLNYEIMLQPFRLIKDKWQCFHCEEKMPSFTKLCRHTTAHYRQHTCDVCGRSYFTSEALKYHVRCSHTGNFVCRKCWQEFPSSEERRDHIRSSKKCWTFACVYCGERFQSWESKNRHLVDNHGCPEVKYPCPDCDSTFQSRKNFYAHYKTAHTDESFMCSFCGLKFATKIRLEDHRVGHTGEKPYKCSECSKCFMRKKSLVQHMWIHKESKRFVCLMCDKQFAQKVSFKSHMRTHHPDVGLEF